MIHYILFTGHMIDKSNRPTERFPAYKEDSAREQIKQRLLNVINHTKGEFFGIAGGACGGDIIFHELCIELKIRSELYLALLPAEFKEASVSFAGEAWDKRFNHLLNVLPHTQLKIQANEKENENVWEQANLWMLTNALKNGGKNMTLIALWDGKGGDGNGGAEHMVNIAKEKGASVDVIGVDEL